jgi:hypothetical protein
MGPDQHPAPGPPCLLGMTLTNPESLPYRSWPGGRPARRYATPGAGARWTTLVAVISSSSSGP